MRADVGLTIAPVQRGVNARAAAGTGRNQRSVCTPTSINYGGETQRKNKLFHCDNAPNLCKCPMSFAAKAEVISSRESPFDSV